MRQHLIAWVVILTAASSLLADAKDDVRKLLVGKWQIKQKMGEREVTGVMELAGDGRASMKVTNDRGEKTFAGTFQLIDENTVEITYKVGELSTMDRSKVKVTKETLELTDAKGKVQRYTRLP
jgi:uncharacterized protein (TIGR03066 family)